MEASTGIAKSSATHGAARSIILLIYRGPLPDGRGSVKAVVAR